MDDTRIEWIQRKVYSGFQLSDPDIFREFLSFRNGAYENELISFLNSSCPGEGRSVVFFVTAEEHEEEFTLDLGSLYL